MESPHTQPRRDRTRDFRSMSLPRAAFSDTWREGAALAAGFLVLLVTTWLIWAALAEAAIALAEAT